MDDFAKSAFLWAERILEERKELGICCALVSVLDPKEKGRGTTLYTKDVIEIFLPFAKTFDGFGWKYPGDELPYRGKATIREYWFIPRGFLAPRKKLIHCLLSNSPL
jgi:hypothetical protein